MRVLIIEDEEKVAEFNRKGLQQEGYAVDVVRDGEEGGGRATRPRLLTAKCAPLQSLPEKYY